jgi:hypothetical protein
MSRLNNIASVYDELGERQKALQYYGDSRMAVPRNPLNSSRRDQQGAATLHELSKA